MFYDLEGQKKRAAQINRLVIENHLKDIDSEGNLIGDKWKQGNMREVLFLCEALWSTDKCYSEIIEKVLVKSDIFDKYSTFNPLICMIALKAHKHNLTELLIEKFETYVKDSMKQNLLPEWDFIGVNDNTPAMIMACIMMAGEYFGNSDWLEVGRRRLYQFRDMMKRRSFISEYNSPTYSAITIHALASIVNYVEDKEIRELALECEIKLWEKNCLLYHPHMCQTVGPYARAYTVDKLAFTYSNRYLFYALLGDKCAVNPINTIFAGNHDENYYYQVANASFVNMEYHCPVELVEGIFNRSYPYIVQGTAETSVSLDDYLIKPIGDPLSKENLSRNDLSALDLLDDISEYPAGVIGIYSYIDEKYALGTATRDWHNGASSDNFFLIYKTKDIVTCQEHIATVFANYVVNGLNEQQDVDNGRKIGIQHENTAMTLYRPKWCGEIVSTAGLKVVFSNYTNAVNNLRIGTETYSINDLKQSNFLYQSKKLQPIYVEASGLYMFFYPLIAERDQQEASIEITCEGQCLNIMFFNYKGEPKQFHKRGFCQLTNGFICKVGKAEEYTDFDAFIHQMQKFKINDYLRSNVHTRYALEREVSFTLDDIELSCCYSPMSDGIKYITVNGELLEEVNG